MKQAEEFITKLAQFEDYPSVVFNEVSYSYTNLTEKIAAFREEFTSKPIVSGEVVLVKGDYSFESIALFLALAANGNIIVPVTSLNESEISERIEEAKPNWLIDLNNQSWDFLPENKEVKRHELLSKIISAGDAGLILFSSGSTGRPKAMIHNLNHLLSSYLDRRPKHISFLVLLMFDHIGGLNTMLNCLGMGAKIVIPNSRNPEYICQLIEQYKVNVLPTSPTFLNLLYISGAYESYDLSSLKMITYGTEPMPESLLVKLKEIFKKVKFLQTFGTSETGIAKTVSKSSTSTFIKIDDPNQEYKIVDGELWLRSKTQILGYLNHNNDSFTEDGWFKTGDLVEETEDGFIKIIGRNKEIINVGGEKVLPSEVESVILEVPEITDCLVYGKSNSITGQMVVANVLLQQEGKDTKEVKRLIKSHCQQKLDAYKVPSKIAFVNEIKYSERGKKVRI
jgi:acyl-coenzyme A synthetase/AMP-(fatty) acid ligase